ncbi:MAG TPA: hypothetical protein VGD88_04455 [Opitutaceae bacterium]
MTASLLSHFKSETILSHFGQENDAQWLDASKWRKSTKEERYRRLSRSKKSRTEQDRPLV